MEHITINIKATGMDLTSAISGHVEKKMRSLEKLMVRVESDILMEVEVAKTTNHHTKSDKLFRAECRLTFSGNDFYASAHESDLYVAIDRVQEKLFRDVRQERDRKRNLFIRGARSIKKRIQGWKSW